MKRLQRRIAAQWLLTKKLEDGIARLEEQAGETRASFAETFRELHAVHDMALQLLQEMTTTGQLAADQNLRLLVRFDEPIISQVVTIADIHLLCSAVKKQTHARRVALEVALHEVEIGEVDTILANVRSPEEDKP